jgi:hypothetical protein
MPRNLSRRLETMFPIEDPKLKRRIVDEILALKLKDNVRARELSPDGCYMRLRPKRGQARVNSQAMFLAMALEEHAPEPSRPFSADLLVHEPAGSRAANNGARPLTLTSIYPLRSGPPDLPAVEAQPPDPQAPELELTGQTAEPPDGDELSDTAACSGARRPASCGRGRRRFRKLIGHHRGRWSRPRAPRWHRLFGQRDAAHFSRIAVLRCPDGRQPEIVDQLLEQAG